MISKIPSQLTVSAGELTVTYKRAGRKFAVVTVHRDLESLREELAMKESA